ncbi:hypothetical protein 10S1_57 [uncultured Caudovirales phage]|uniref:Uncharacterized protein n=1 Tax=uncultured Caudovirales phage TaxID=2100421 RepID=A0A2H4J5P5_9CAUD|nr:hypothetical protein 10S1_57 [uncultured Caudovirales phage]
MQYLIRKIHHTTDEVFLDATKAKENEKFTVVEAESKEEALEKAKYKIQCPRCESVDIDYEYYYEDSNEPSYIYIICHTCMGVSLEEVRKDSE